MKVLFIVWITISSPFLWGWDLLKDFDSLGGNGALLERLRESSKGKGVQIVQNRMTDRTNRLELFADYQYTSRGNTYLDSSSSAASFHFHINPRWSLGAKYNYFFNDLTPEAEGIINEALEVQKINPNVETALIPELNWPKSSTMALISYYPIYGKANIFNQGIVHFDLYATLGAGQMELRNGTSQTWLGGVGVGLWLSQYLSARLEYNYQGYEAEYLQGVKELSVNTLSFGFGYLL
ncbi:MAG: outer membrane beta-barrel domain-containing protein [Bacteriovoracales bacterium]|nr:outer membrane beta-barrel domain-containing protein [Bacteriovoracales bacterium]